jgi:REP element-mobilizing transposase RayT/thiol-disulfide isomerase/thioredoxin
MPVNRKSIRLKDYDYTQEGAYYVTACVNGRECIFGDVDEGKMVLNEYGKIAEITWLDLINHNHNIELDEFIVMPNHIHGIIVITGKYDVGAGSKPALKSVPSENIDKNKIIDGKLNNRAGLEPAPIGHGLSEIIRQFKTFSAKRINQMNNTPGKCLWQRNFYEHVIRDEHGIARIREYIVNNPAQWEEDEYYTPKRQAREGGKIEPSPFFVPLFFLKGMMKKNIIKTAVCVFALALVFGNTARAEKTGAPSRRLIIDLQGIFDAKVSLMPFEGARPAKPIAEAPNVKGNERITVKIPDQYLPGEFILRIDYRAKETDRPYPAERNIYVNKQDVEVAVNPFGMDNNDIIKFAAGESENTTYKTFLEENHLKRAPIDLLMQFLLSYDRPDSKFYRRAIKELQQRRSGYNDWLRDQTRKHHGLFISRLFQFQYIPNTPSAAWSGDENERFNKILENYFEGIDFTDPIIIRSRELPMFMDNYIRMYGMRAVTEEQRALLFIKAGRIACEKASKGHPKVYGWMVDYFYKGYETYNIKQGITMLEEHINNPDCLTTKKQQITKRLEGIKRLVPGVLAPDFVVSDNTGKDFIFHQFETSARYKLLLFWSTDCGPCRQLLNELISWHNQPANKASIDVIALNVDDLEMQAQKWETIISAYPSWRHFYLKGGTNNPVADDYSILSTPVMFLIDSRSNAIASVPGSFEQLIKDQSPGTDTEIAEPKAR